MAKDSTITNVDNGDDLEGSWGDTVKASVEALFDDKTVYDQAYSATTEIDLNNGAFQKIDLAGNVAIDVVNQKLFRPFAILVKYDADGRTIDFFDTISWAYNYVPVSSANGKYDLFVFIPITFSTPNWTYIGLVAGQDI